MTQTNTHFPTESQRSLSHTSTKSPVYSLEVNGIRIYRVRDLALYPRLKHAIFTRHGGSSHSPFQSLNFSTSVGDDAQTVEQNFQKACQTVGVQPDQTVSCRLVHGADVLTVHSPSHQHFIGAADSLLTDQKDLFLFMRYGDCTPILLFDPVRPAVGLSHAGWRGTMQNVAGVTVQRMVEQFGSRPENIIAVIGPTIGPCCYEVGPEVIDAGLRTFNNSNNLFRYPNGPQQRPYFDLWQANAHQLAEAGVGKIIQSELCTACHSDEFFSHRAENGKTGRFGVLIGLMGKT